VGPPFEGLSYNYVAPALTREGSEVVLKMGLPRRELETEIAALWLYNGRGAVKLLDVNAELGALLLERLRPGTLLVTLRDDDQCTAAAAQVMKALWRPVPDTHPFPTVFDWARAFSRLRERYSGGTGPIEAAWVEQAEAVFAEFEQTPSGMPVLLHGDLHHMNILSAQRSPWLAVDPKGVVGEPAYEPGALLRNPVPAIFARSDLPRLTARRIDQLAEHLEIDRRRIASWGMAQAVLSAVWNVEERKPVGSGWLLCARACHELMS
jgi:streptomycin 6-kinase